MANHKSALKRARQNATRRTRNRANRTALRTTVKKVREQIESKDAGLKESLVEAQTRLDRAAVKGLIHPNKAARTLSRLTRKAAAK